jgi:hypothetical protein
VYLKASNMSNLNKLPPNVPRVYGMMFRILEQS